MVSLSAIPVELLDRIIELVLLDERRPPPNVQTALQSRAEIDDPPLEITLMVCPQYLPPPRYEECAIQANATSLLLASRFLRTQTVNAITRVFPNGIRYKLDIMMVNERELWPTWLHFPAVSKSLASVDVSLRIFGTHREQAEKSSRSGFTRGDGGPPTIYWSFYYLLERFLRLGLMELPAPVSVSEGVFKKQVIDVKDIGLSVQTIAIEVSTGDHGQPTYDNTDEDLEKWESSFRGWRRGNGADDETVNGSQMHPEWLAVILGRNFNSLLSVGYHFSKYGNMFFERMNNFKISVQGETPQEYLLGAALARRRASPQPGSDWYTQDTFGHLPGDCRMLTFWNWKYAIVQKRMALGLQMPGPIEWPTHEELLNLRDAVARERKREGERWWSDSCEGGRCKCKDTELEMMLRNPAQNAFASGVGEKLDTPRRINRIGLGMLRRF